MSQKWKIVVKVKNRCKDYCLDLLNLAKLGSGPELSPTSMVREKVPIGLRSGPILILWKVKV